MIARTLKIQLFTQFLLTLISFTVFYYWDSLPDSYFGISSAQQSLPWFSYYFVSFFAKICYFTGPWIVFPFLLNLLFYSVAYSKREFYLDIAAQFLLILTSLFWTFLISPTFVGGALESLLLKKFDIWEIYTISICSVLAFVGIVFRQGFLDLILTVSVGIKRGIFYSAKKLIDLRLISIPSIGIIFEPVAAKLRGASQIRIKKFKKNPSVIESRSSKDSDNYISVNSPSLVNVQKSFDKPIVEDTKMEEKSIDKNGQIQMKSVSSSSSQNTVLASFKDKSQNDSNKYFSLVNSFTADVKKGATGSAQPSQSYFDDIKNRIEEKLGEFGIEGQIISVLKGPVVDTFELELGAGVRIAKLTSSAEDLSLALLGSPVRIVYPMKGRATVGIEVPRDPREIIFLDEVLTSKDFQTSSYKLPIAMGKDAFGEPFVVDLAALPHMLIAGATGAGKSVFLNTLLMSLLVKCAPNELKLILIDPKQLELALYHHLPHLAMPVVVDPKTATIAILWAVQEMERRYSILKEFGVRNIQGFNDKLKNATPHMLAKIQDYFRPNEDYKLPYLVIVIDEFADLMLTRAGKEIECNVSRLAGKARASGIHLVVATQRPSVDVVTGLIKNNFTCRVSFRVTGYTDSRTILDCKGAEKLLGKGDMLYKSTGDLVRLHGAYVDENDISAFTQQLEGYETSFDQSAIDFIENGGDMEDDPYAFGSHISSVIKNDSQSGAKDQLFDEAVRIIIEHRAASASMLQRRLKVGYNRAANLIDELERKGAVGAAQGSKPRPVLISSPEELQ